MKILIVTQNAPLYLPAFLESFIKIWKENNEGSVEIFIKPPYGQNSLYKEVVYRYKIYGTKAFLKISSKIFKNFILSNCYKLKFTKNCYSLSNVLKKFSIDRKNFESINSIDSVSYVKNNIDLVISIASPEIFKKEILDAPKYGCINYHTALLPKYRGRQPLFWALLNNEKTTGITIHKMDEFIDKGELIIQKKINIEPQDSLDSLYIKTIEEGPNILFDAIKNLITNKNKLKSLKNNSGVLYKLPTPMDAKKFRKMGKRFI